MGKSSTVSTSQLEIPARDQLRLGATLYRSEQPSGRVVVINSAVAVARKFYGAFAMALAEAGYDVLTYDYRGVGSSRPERLRGMEASIRDWALLDMAGVVDWVGAELAPERLFFVGHSVGGQVAGLLDNGASIDGMITMSAQSGYWRLQGAEQKLVVGFHMHVTFPMLTRLFGYLPMKRAGAGEDIPKGVALEWARWCRSRHYLLDDETLPLERYQQFQAPVLAYSVGDDKWGTPRAVDAMMSAYPNLQRRHINPKEVGLDSIGHFGYFRESARDLWHDAIDWFDAI